MSGGGAYFTVRTVTFIHVAHIKKEGRWAIYNDSKVAVSERPPLELGYMYLYKRSA